jgi:hypothetical protein
MPGARSTRLVASALRCYPRRWRRRHGGEAAQIAALLIQDGTPAWSVAWSYLWGAARARLVSGPRRRAGAAVGALLLAAACLGVPLALLSAPSPAHAASVAHSRTAHARRAGPRTADPWPGGPSPAGRRHPGGRGAAEGCGRVGHR